MPTTMSATDPKSVKSLLSQNYTGLGELLEILPQSLPATYTFADLQSHLVNEDELKKEDILESIVILFHAISESSRLRRVSNDTESIHALSKWVARIILPDSSLTSYSVGGSQTANITKSLQLTRQIAVNGLKLLTLSPRNGVSVDPSVLLAAITYSSRDVWSTPKTTVSAQAILNQNKKQLASSDFIVTYLLQDVIKPLFSKSRPNNVTAAGRVKMQTSAPPAPYDFDAEKNTKPWKYENVYAVGALEWIIENISAGLMKTSWHLLIPPLLTLLDDPSTPIRHRGLILVPIFLAKFPSSLLQQTGLGPVFEDSIVPTLLYLPTLTPIEESEILLPASYRALYALTEAREEKERQKSLDQVMRKGILAGYQYAMEHASIVRILILEIGVVVPKMGIQSVKHLKDVIPILTTQLSEPFATPASLVICISTLIAVILDAWPRIGEDVHRLKILQGLVTCWKNLGDSVAETEDVRKKLLEVGRLFFQVVEQSGEEIIKEEIDKLVEVDPDVEGLFREPK